MHQVWHDLLLVHWPVDVESLRPLVPRPLTIDTFDGTAWITLIPFGMRGVRPTALPPLPFLSSLLEVNARTYVHREGRDPGVWFFSLDASSRLAVQAARAFYHLPYYFASMSMQRSDGRIHYSSRRASGAHCRVSYRPTAERVHAPAGSIDHFLAERYILYSATASALYRAAVSHRPYPLQRAAIESLDESLFRAAGVAGPQTAPAVVHYASRLDVEIFPIARID